MILFDQIIQVLHLPQFHVLRQHSGGFELGNCFGIGGVLVERSSRAEESERWAGLPDPRQDECEERNMPWTAALWRKNVWRPRHRALDSREIPGSVHLNLLLDTGTFILF